MAENFRSKITIEDVETGATLEELGTIVYDSAGRAIRNCYDWYSDEIAAWEERGYQVEIVLVRL